MTPVPPFTHRRFISAYSLPGNVLSMREYRDRYVIPAIRGPPRVCGNKYASKCQELQLGELGGVGRA